MNIFFLYYTTITIILFHIELANCFLDPISLTIGSASVLAGSYFFKEIKDATYCKMYECCNDEWIRKNTHNLSIQLERKVYGQHLVRNYVVNALKTHFNNPNPTKALVLSFHGWPGCGKNYVSSFIVESLYQKGFSSKYVELFIGQMNFPLVDLVYLYKRELKELVTSKVYKCPRQIFIFDEVEKMPAGILDSIKPFMDNYPLIQNVDYRKSVFIFLSNIGGTQIRNHLHSLWKNGITRDETKLHDFEELIRLEAFNENGGLKYSDVVDSSLVDHYIPFLPLERKHIELCIIDEFKNRGRKKPSDATIQEIMNSVIFDQDDMYATSGCKRLEQKVGTYIYHHNL